MIVDATGVSGQFVHYGLTIFFSGSALLLFFYFLLKGKLGLDEEAKEQMMENKD
jgi:hypothetical protein